MTEEEIKKELEKVGAIIRNNHFVYASGLHGDTYIDKELIYPHPELTFNLCYELARCFSDYGIHAVVAPEKGGIILSQYVAYHLSKMYRREVLSYYAEKTADGFEFKRGNASTVLVKKNILVIEDNLTTGGSVKKVIRELKKLNTSILCVGALCNRGNVTAEQIGDIEGELISLTNFDFVTHEEKDCPLCAKYIPVNLKLGKGVDYVNRTKHIKIFSFRDEHRFLSNFYLVNVWFEGKLYPSVEHAFQAAKTLDEERREKIRLMKKPGEAKAEGALIRKDGTLREGWDTGLQLETMELLLKQKFSDEHPELRDLLLGTGEALLVEGNTWEDTFFGVYNGVGENHLGKLLMRRRSEIR